MTPAELYEAHGRAALARALARVPRRHRDDFRGMLLVEFMHLARRWTAERAATWPAWLRRRLSGAVIDEIRRTTHLSLRHGRLVGAGAHVRFLSLAALPPTIADPSAPDPRDIRDSGWQPGPVLDRLNPRQSSVLRLELAGLNQRQISRRQRTSEHNISQIRQRALTRCRELLAA